MSPLRYELNEFVQLDCLLVELVLHEPIRNHFFTTNHKPLFKPIDATTSTNNIHARIFIFLKTVSAVTNVFSHMNRQMPRLERFWIV